MPGINTDPSGLCWLLRALEVFEGQTRALLDALNQESDEVELDLEDRRCEDGEHDYQSTGDEELDRMLREQHARETEDDLSRVETLARRYRDARDELMADLESILGSGELADCEAHLRLLIPKLEDYISGR